MSSWRSRWLMRFLFTWVVNTVALGVAAWLVGDVSYDSYGALALAGLVFAAVNTFIKPVLVVLGIPFIILTLGIGLFLINMGIVWLTAWLRRVRLLADRQGRDRDLVHQHGAERVLARPPARRRGRGDRLQ